MNSYKKTLNLLEHIDYIDMHIHMEDFTPDDNYDNILYFANAIDEDSYRKTLTFAEEFENIVPSFGIHPMRAYKCLLSKSQLENLMIGNDFIGEIGIDNFWIEDKRTYDKQKEVFEAQLAIVKKHKMIPSIHTKGAEELILDLLQKYEIKKSIIHWYSGSLELIPAFLDLGSYFTIGPDIFSESKVYNHIPPGRIFVETDNPTGIPWIIESEYLGDDIIKVYGKLAEKLGFDERELISQCKQNLRDLILK